MASPSTDGTPEPENDTVRGPESDLAPGTSETESASLPPGDQDLPTADARPAERRPVPSQEELERIAVDVRIRRRPRYGVFIGLGMVLAGLAALAWTASVPQSQHVNWGATVWVTTIGAAAFGALLGAGAAVFADWSSRRK